MTQTIVILGAAYAGLHIAHYLLKQKNPDVKIILVSKETHFYWNMASVRAVVPNIIKDEQLYGSLEEALQRYPKESWELVIGRADAANFGEKKVTVQTAAGEVRTLDYNHLVLATGSRTPTGDVPWKTVDSYEHTRSLLHATADRVQTAGHIVVAGGGPTGVELAGELGFEYGKTKEVILLNGGSKLLGGDSIAASVATELKKLNVDVRYNSYVESTRALPTGKTEVVLVGGEIITTDLYMPTHGLVPNSEYIDGQFLDNKKNVKVDDYYRVPGAENVWAAGDIVSKPRCGFLITQKQAAGVAKNIDAVLKGKAPSVVKLMPLDILACSVGRSRGAGRAGPIKMFSLMVYMAKGKTLGLQQLPSYIDGSVA